MSLSIYTYSNPYTINKEPYWDSIKNCAHFCVSQTMVNGLTDVYDDLKNGQVATVQSLVESLYPHWFDTKTYISQYAAVSNILSGVTPKDGFGDWTSIKQALDFNKSSLLDSIRMLCEMNIAYEDINGKKLSKEQLFLIAVYKTALKGEYKELFNLKSNFTSEEINKAIELALVVKEEKNNRPVKSLEKVDCDTVIIHGVHQFTPTILSMIEAVQKYKRVVLLFNYQEQYSSVYQTWLDVYSCFDINIKSQFNTEFKPSSLLSTSYEGNLLADTLAKLVNGQFDGKPDILSDFEITEFDNITEFASYVAQFYEEAASQKKADPNKKKSALYYMNEQFYAANSSVNDILKVYFPEQFGERHFLAYPIGHFFVAVTNMWNEKEGGIRIENMDDIAECLYSEVLPEKKLGSLITTFNATKNFFNRATTLETVDDNNPGIIELLKKLRKHSRKIHDGSLFFSEQLAKLEYYNIPESDLDDLITALELLNKITNVFYEDFEKEENNFLSFYKRIKDFIEQQILPTAEAESEFQEIIVRLLARLEEIDNKAPHSSFDCLKETMHYYLMQEKNKGESADWIVRDFQQIDGDILKSDKQDREITYHFACVSDDDMNVKREDQFPWPLDVEFFERAYEPLDWKYQVYVKSRKEYKHFKRYALIYGLEFNRCKFKISYVKNDDDKENEPYYMLKLLGAKIFEYKPAERELPEAKEIVTTLGGNKNKFVDFDVYRRRICGYRFAIETLLYSGTKYKDQFLQTKYFEIMLANRIRRKLEGHPATEIIINEAIEGECNDLKRYFEFLNESALTDVKLNVKRSIKSQILENGKLKYFPAVTDDDEKYMQKKEEFMYLQLLDDDKKNVLSGMFSPISYDEKVGFKAQYLRDEEYKPSVNLWCQWCAVRELCLEYYKSPVEM